MQRRDWWQRRGRARLAGALLYLLLALMMAPVTLFVLGDRLAALCVSGAIVAVTVAIAALSGGFTARKG